MVTRTPLALRREAEAEEDRSLLSVSSKPWLNYRVERTEGIVKRWDGRVTMRIVEKPSRLREGGWWLVSQNINVEAAKQVNKTMLGCLSAGVEVELDKDVRMENWGQAGNKRQAPGRPKCTGQNMKQRINVCEAKKESVKKVELLSGWEAWSSC